MEKLKSTNWWEDAYNFVYSSKNMNRNATVRVKERFGLEERSDFKGAASI